MLLAAGFGERLQPITNKIPKPLILIDKQPILKYILQHYENHSLTKPIIINTHHLASQFKNFFELYPRGWIQESFEPQILGTGKGLFFAKNYFHTEHFWLQNADILCPYNPLEMMHFHRKNNAIATLATCPTPITSSRVKIGKNNQIIGFEKFNNTKEQDTKLQTFCGIHCISKKLFSLFSFEEVPTDIIKLYQMLIEKKEKILYWEIKKNAWIDIGTPENLAYIQKHKQQFLYEKYY